MKQALFILFVAAFIACNGQQPSPAAIHPPTVADTDRPTDWVLDSLNAVYARRIDSLRIALTTRQAPAPVANPEPADTGETYTAKDGTVYPIHTGKRGGRYITRTSKNGKQYNQYLK